MSDKITSSIVLYKNDIDVLQNAIESLLNTGLNIKLFLVDNSPTNDLEILAKDSRIEYIHNSYNSGFGAAHNIAIKKAIETQAKYHFVINPDIHFHGDVITPMLSYMEQNKDVGMMMPKILNNDSTIQNLPKLLPNPLWIFRRKLQKFDPNGKKFIDKYELRDFSEKQIFNVPFLSGCFTLLRLDAIKEIGMYDEDFFMYFEDFDLSRRMHQKYKTMYFPQVSVYHGYEGGANKNFKLFIIFLKSMITYFNKWGWFFDSKRKIFNQKTLNQFK